jgi:hypothetical protein
MAGDGEDGQPAEMQAERTVEESTRPACAKPVIRRFSLQKTLSGSGHLSDNNAISASMTYA